VVDMYSEAARMDIGKTLFCPVCRSNCIRNEGLRLGMVLCICRICGRFTLDSKSAFYLDQLSATGDNRIYKVSFALRAIAERAHGKLDDSQFPAYSVEEINEMLGRVDPSVQEKLVLLLKYLGRLTDYPGQVNEFDSATDYAVIGASNAHEASFHFTSLAEQGLTSIEPAFTSRQNPRFTVTAKGWQELNRIEQLGSESSNAFIAMSFRPERDPYEKAISSAVRAAGYRPVRVDQIEHVNNIDDEIIARIRSSKFLISDFTLQSPGVYFEAGFMLGLGRPVFWLCEKKDIKNVHFDTRQYNTIDYIDGDDLRTRLQFRIEAILGKGPHAEK
jgi:nucleoside 2-deoxyribosyltransferase